MVLQKKGGIGKIGVSFASFLHPSRAIQDKWLNDWKKWKCEGVIICGKGMYNVSRKTEMCYDVHVPEIDDNTIFHIVCCNFSVQTKGPAPFKDKVSLIPREIAAISAPVLAEEPIFSTNSAVGRSADIADLLADGIEVDDKDPAPENAVAQPGQRDRQENGRNNLSALGGTTVQSQIQLEGGIKNHSPQLQPWKSSQCSAFVPPRRTSKQQSSP
jgi:hypothetical protein